VLRQIEEESLYEYDTDRKEERKERREAFIKHGKKQNKKQKNAPDHHTRSLR